jgi:hypothetical protein
MSSRSTATAVIVLSTWCGLAPLAAEEVTRDVAFVEAATGRVVALASGSPRLLGPLDTITDRTRIDLLASSELRICHYQTAQFLTFHGPARIMVSASGVSVEVGKPADNSRETCSAPQAATSTQGGFVARGVKK